MLLLFLCSQAISSCEQNIYETISHDWEVKPVTYVMQGIEVASWPGLDAVPPIGLYIYDKKDIARKGFLGFVGDVATVLSLKMIVNRERPEGESERIDSSFPSGHTTFAFTQAVIYSHHNPKLRVPLFIYATIVGFSRVYLGKHYPTDVLGGAVLGVAVGLISVNLF